MIEAGENTRCHCCTYSTAFGFGQPELQLILEIKHKTNIAKSIYKIGNKFFKVPICYQLILGNFFWNRHFLLICNRTNFWLKIQGFLANAQKIVAARTFKHNLSFSSAVNKW